MIKNKKDNIIGRVTEKAFLNSLLNKNEAKMLIVYGRRRVGKTFLIENTFVNKKVWKFEGVENQPEKRQRAIVLERLAAYVAEPIIAKVGIDSWLEVFQLIAKYCQDGEIIIYFEEVQWLADYKDLFASELKLVWDNNFKKNNNLLLILCGSSPSFMVSKIVMSKALYNRSQYELHLQEFSLLETKLFLKSQRSKHEVLDAYLSIGGIPEYLKYLDQGSSVFIGLCQNSFSPNSFFSREYEKVLVSSFSQSKHYQAIIELLAQYKNLSRNEIVKKLKIDAGGSLTEVFEDLEKCGFIASYSPFHLANGNRTKRYAISDNYLQFYFKFIKPRKKDIQLGRYKDSQTKAVSNDIYRKWLGFALERYLRTNHFLLAEKLGFAAVDYKAGSYFERDGTDNFQCDLIFDRTDKVLTVCEIKYTEAASTKTVVKEFESKLSRLSKLSKHKTINKVLISINGCEKNVKDSFDTVITIDDLI